MKGNPNFIEKEQAVVFEQHSSTLKTIVVEISDLKSQSFQIHKNNLEIG